MKHTYVLVIGLAITAGSMALADDAAVRKELAAQYTKFGRAMKKKDVQTIFGLATPDFKIRTKNGQTLNAQQARAMLSMQLQAAKVLSTVQSNIQKLTVNGSTATAVVVTKVVGQIQEKPGGKLHTMTDVGTTHDTWVKTPQGWRIKREEEVADKATLDGKPFNPGVPPPSAPRARKVGKRR